MAGKRYRVEMMSSGRWTLLDGDLTHKQAIARRQRAARTMAGTLWGPLRSGKDIRIRPEPDAARHARAVEKHTAGVFASFRRNPRRDRFGRFVKRARVAARRRGR